MSVGEAGDPFAIWLLRWELVADGTPIATFSSDLLPVVRGAEPLMLKVARHEEERFGSGLLAWWNGDGAVRVFAAEGDAILMERAIGRRSLVTMSMSGHDDEALRIICGVVAQLHAPRPGPQPDAIPLTRWFRSLLGLRGGPDILGRAADTAQALLEAPRDERLLHGDIHHGNILDGGQRGFLAIDPKRLRGERGFDFANLFCNPDIALAANPSAFARRVALVSATAHIDRQRLLEWILAWTGLSAAWQIAEAPDVLPDLRIAELAAGMITAK